MKRPCLHTAPFDTKGSDILLLIVFMGLLASDEVTFLDTGSQATSANDVQKIKLLLPAHSAAEEMAVESKGIARVGRVLASEPESG